MKRAFTLVELVLVVVVIGIISAVMVPRIDNVEIDKVAQQVVDHIRYTRHLAMMDNRFDPEDTNWYKERWQIRFQYTGSSPRKYYYTIYSDSDKSGGYSQSEIAKNPLNQAQILTGKKDISTTTTGMYTKQMDLYNSFGITSVSLTGCRDGGVSGALRFGFDYLGRPIVKNMDVLTKPYSSTSELRLATKTCNLKLTDSAGNKITISIEPESGYTYISKIERVN